MPYRCKHPDCKRTANYNYVGEKPAYCGEHRKENMKNTKDKRCELIGCNEMAYYGLYNEPPIRCHYHKLEGMVQRKQSLCEFNGCNVRACYNYPGESNGLYCLEHRKEDMINVKIKCCDTEGCKERARYNFIGKTYSLKCYNHKLDGMIDKHQKYCLYSGCKKQARYNSKDNNVPQWCGKHKEDGMYCIYKIKCKEPDCEKTASFNFKGKQPIYCKEHITNKEMIDVRSLRCKNDWCDTRINKTTNKNDGYCLFCYVNMFPDRAITRNYKTKESCVVKYVKDTYEEYDWIADKKVEGGCSKRRPDLMLDLGYQVVIIEVDENQHTDYECSCENKRLMEISQDLGHRPIVFIRFNPDDYTTKEGEKITSCWGINKLGVCSIKKTKQKQWEKRLENLNNQIKYWIENKTEKTVEVVQLYYDEN